MKRQWLCETGGPLVGYHWPPNQIVVVAASGPGPKSWQSIWEVEIDGEHSQQFCDALYQSSSGRYDYIGDWHCHPSFSITPSLQDAEAIALMAEVKGVVDNPISVIASKFTGKFYGYFWTGEALESVRLIVETSDVPKRP